MVRPNQIIKFDEERDEITFIMFARSEDSVKRRVLWINFPKMIRRTLLGRARVDDFVVDVRKVTDGMVNRYAVTLDAAKISSA